MATHSSVLAWRIPETGEPGGLPSMGSHRVGHDWSDLAAAHCSLGLQASKGGREEGPQSAECPLQDPPSPSNTYRLTITLCLKDCCCCCSITKSYLTPCYPWTTAHQASLSFTIAWSDKKKNCFYLIFYIWWVVIVIYFFNSLNMLLLFSCSVMSDSLRPHGLQHARLPCPSLSLGVCSSSCPLSQWCHPTISFSVVPFSLCLQSFPASGAFPMNWLFASGSQSIGASASASVLPMNIQGWFLLGLTGLISWLSEGLSRVFSSTTVWKTSVLRRSAFFMAQLSHPYMTTGKTISQSVQLLSRVQLFVTTWTAACQASLSITNSLFLWLCLFILSGVISPLLSSSILGTYWPGEFIF